MDAFSFSLRKCGRVHPWLRTVAVPRGRNQSANLVQTVRGHAAVDGFVVSRLDEIGVVPDAYISAAVSNPAVETKRAYGSSLGF